MSETDKRTIFGILEKTYYDNRESTAQTGSGFSVYKAIALVEVPSCEKCSKAFKYSFFFKNLSICLLILAGIFGFFKLIELNSEIATPIILGCSVIFIFIFIQVCRHSLEDMYLSKYERKKSIDTEDIIAPFTTTPIKITPMNGNLDNRWTVSYRVVASKKLEKINLEKLEKSLNGIFANEKNKEFIILKRWYNNQLAQNFDSAPTSES